MESLIYGPANPGNLGTIIRSAVALGVKKIWVYDIHGLLERRSRSFCEIKRASMGTCSLVETNPINNSILLQKFLEEYNGRKITTVCDSEDSIDLPHFICQENDLVLFGNERDGLPKDIAEREDFQRLRIPMQKSINSLNLSCAFTIIAYEYMKQNRIII